MGLLLALTLLAACSRLSFWGGDEAQEPVSASVTLVNPVISSAPQAANLASSMRSLQGKILFKSNRDGAERLYIMDEDGSNAVPFDQSPLYAEAAQLESFSPSRRQQVIVQRFGDGQYLFVRELGTELKEQLTGGPWAYYAPAWRPNGRQIAYVTEIEGRPFVHLVNVDDGATSFVLSPSVGESSHPSWSPQGDRLALTVNNGQQRQIWIASLDGSNPQNLTTGSHEDWDPVWIKATPNTETEDAPAETQAQIGVGWSVDRCLVRVEAVDRLNGGVPIERVQIVSASGINFDSGAISVRDFRQTMVLDLAPGTHAVELRIWNADQHKEQPLVVSDTLFCLTQTPTATVMPTPTIFVVEPTPEPSDIFDAATRVAQGNNPTGPLPIGAVVATTTPQPVIITNTPTPENEATRSYEIAFATAAAATTGTPTPLPPWWMTATPTATDTATPLPTDTPVSVPWAPRGVLAATPQPTPTQPIPPVLRGRILFQSDRDGHTDIYSMNPDGSDIQKLTAAWPYEQALAMDTVSSDGIYRVFVGRDSRSFQVFFHDAQFKVDERVSLLGAGDAWDPAIDASGWRVAFVSNEPGNDELYVSNRDGSDLRRLTENEWEWDRHPSWSPDGAEIVFWSNRDGRKQLYVVSPDGTNLRRISDGFGNDWDPVWVK